MKSTLFALTVLFSQVHAQYTAEILPIPGGRGQALGAGGGQIIGVSIGSGGPPGMWDGKPYSFTSMMPSGFDAAGLLGVGGGKQVGYAHANGRSHALLWSGSANNYVDLDVPSYITGTSAWATDGINQVGAGGVDVNIGHALLWHGTAQSVVDLHPAGYEYSHAYGVWGAVQVGVIEHRPVMWNGSAASMEFLPLPKGTLGTAEAVHGDQIVGTGDVSALLWSATSHKLTLLGPGSAFDTNGVHQVGERQNLGEARAIRWSGTEASAHDLHQYLPSNIAYSRATGIDESGTIVGWGHINGGFGSVPIVWTPVPESSSIVAVGIGMLALCFRRRIRRS